MCCIEFPGTSLKGKIISIIKGIGNLGMSQKESLVLNAVRKWRVGSTYTERWDMGKSFWVMLANWLVLFGWKDTRDSQNLVDVRVTWESWADCAGFWPHRSWLRTAALFCVCCYPEVLPRPPPLLGPRLSCPWLGHGSTCVHTRAIPVNTGT